MHFAEVAGKVPSTYMNEWDGKRGSGSLWLQLYPGLEHEQGYGWLYLIAVRLRGRPCILYHVHVAGEIGSVELEQAHLPYRQAGICFTSSGQRAISPVAGTHRRLWGMRMFRDQRYLRCGTCGALVSAIGRRGEPGTPDLAPRLGRGVLRSYRSRTCWTSWQTITEEYFMVKMLGICIAVKEAARAYSKTSWSAGAMGKSKSKQSFGEGRIADPSNHAAGRRGVCNLAGREFGRRQRDDVTGMVCTSHSR